PAFVTESLVRRPRDRLITHAPRSFVVRLLIQGQLYLLVEPPVGEPLPEAVSGVNRLAIDGQKIITHGDFDPVLVGRAFFENMGHLVAARKKVRLQNKA